MIGIFFSLISLVKKQCKSTFLVKIVVYRKQLFPQLYESTFDSMPMYAMFAQKVNSVGVPTVCFIGVVPVSPFFQCHEQQYYHTLTQGGPIPPQRSSGIFSLQFLCPILDPTVVSKNCKFIRQQCNKTSTVFSVTLPFQVRPNLLYGTVFYSSLLE